MLVPFLLGVVGIDDLEDLDGELNSDLVQVDSYERADGTVVASHFRTAPDGDITNNLSFWDLVNL